MPWKIPEKIVFLDVDGVLNNEITNAVAPSGCTGVIDSKVKLLKRIVDATGAKVVLSSDWRLCKPSDPDYKYLVNKLKYKGGIVLYGKTPDINWRYRGQEVLAWLGEHPHVKSWVVLDDNDFDFYRKEFDNHVIITDFYYGLSEDDVEEAIKILNGEET